jgi:hypothetical protein
MVPEFYVPQINLFCEGELKYSKCSEFMIWYTFRISFSAICWRSVVLRQVFRAAKVNASGIYWQFQKHIECKLNAHAIYRQRLVLRLSTKIFDSIFRDFFQKIKIVSTKIFDSIFRDFFQKIKIVSTKIFDSIFRDFFKCGFE